MTYAAAGVDIEAGDRMVDMIKADMRRTYGPRVLGRHGAFAGCFRLDYNEKLFQRNYRDPVLVSCTDGVGTKVLLARDMDRLDTLGRDLVAMSVNDLVVQGAEPLFFLDYIGTHQLEPGRMAALVRGVADGCQMADCALLGGETAEMPDIYQPGDFDLAGFAVGVAELRKIVDGSRAEPGDVLLGLGSSGVHSNGYTLVRAILKQARLKLNQPFDDGGPFGEGGAVQRGGKGGPSGRTLGEALLEPTRIYARAIVAVLRDYKVKRPVSAMCHVTGGGLPGNIPRMLHDKVDARIDMASFPRPAVFDLLQEAGRVEEAEMRRVFNCGLGYVLAVKPLFVDNVTRLLKRHGESVHAVGEITAGSGKLRLD